MPLCNEICSLPLTAVKPVPKGVHLFDRALSNQIHTCAAQAEIVSSCLKSGITFCPLATPASFDEGFTVKIACRKYVFTCLFLFQKWTLDFQCKPVKSFTLTLSSRFNPQTFRFQSRLLLFLLHEDIHCLVYVGQLLKKITTFSSSFHEREKHNHGFLYAPEVLAYCSNCWSKCRGSS